MTNHALFSLPAYIKYIFRLSEIWSSHGGECVNCDLLVLRVRSYFDKNIVLTTGVNVIPSEETYAFELKCAGVFVE